MQKLVYNTAPKVQKLNTRLTSIEGFREYVLIFNEKLDYCQSYIINHFFHTVWERRAGWSKVMPILCYSIRIEFLSMVSTSKACLLPPTIRPKPIFLKYWIYADFEVCSSFLNLTQIFCMSSNLFIKIIFVAVQLSHHKNVIKS